jgi:hypothetical protein
MCRLFGGLIVCVFSALEGSVLQVSEQGLRKVLYQKVCVLGLWCGVMADGMWVCRLWLRSRWGGCRRDRSRERVCLFYIAFESQC